MWATPSAHEVQSTTMLQPYGCARGSSVHILCSPAHHLGAGDPPSASPGGPGLVVVHLEQSPSPASSCHLLSLLPLQSRDSCAEMEQQRQNMTCYERFCSCYDAEPQLGGGVGGIPPGHLHWTLGLWFLVPSQGDAKFTELEIFTGCSCIPGC